MKGSTCFLFASLLGSVCSLSCSSPVTPAVNCPLTGYVASTSATMYSFATDIAPILSSQASCAAATTCHGSPAQFLDSAMTKTLPFAAPAATVKAALLGFSLNAPSMKIVVPGNVGSSFLAYKVSGQDALTCIQSNCTAHATTGTITACGDPMPALSLGVLADADRTKILDWIAQGAKD